MSSSPADFTASSAPSQNAHHPGAGADGSGPELHRRSITIYGVVQGVGMRPHIATVAERYPITGWCGNNEAAVFLEAQGPESQIEAFLAEVLGTLPPLAHVVDTESTQIPVVAGEAEFRIVASTSLPGQRSLIPPDVAPCTDCMAEFHDPNNRRYHYPFITCTQCGPRLSIIEALPYDRSNTTLRGFPMCPACTREYNDPTDRRYHAQPIACPDCGPNVWLEGEQLANQIPGTPADGYEALRSGVHAFFDEGKTLAVRGIGGFHLMCDATNERAIATLRRRKHRPHKALAVMVPDLATAEKLVELDATQRELLVSPARPIVIAPSRGVLPEAIAPGLGEVGVVLAYSPLHALLVDRPVVATSGNPPGEPLVTKVDAARHLLSGFCDGFVMHDRGIASPVEDSVVLGHKVLRRSRGMAPLPVRVGEGPDVFAVGGEIKNTACLTSGQWAHISTHIGDMGSLRAQQRLDQVFRNITSLRDAPPEAVVCDLHPGYSTTAWAEKLADRLDVPLLQVQHHAAHAASVLADAGLIDGHQMAAPAVVIAADGTGYGSDGTIWGGEIFAVSPELKMQRRWHVPQFALVGGDKAVRQPWRSALAVAAAWELEGPRVEALREAVGGACPQELELVDSQLATGAGTVATSSLGRVFDAAASLLGCGNFGTAITYESQAAMLLEHLASSADGLENLGDRAAILAGAGSAASAEVGAECGAASAQGALRALCAEALGAEGNGAKGKTAAIAARRFHWRIAKVLADATLTIAEKVGTKTIAISGGCALNRILVSDLREQLRAHGVELLTHQAVPAGDGGLSLGQAVLGRAQLSAR